MEHFWKSCGASDSGDIGLPHIITSNVEHDSVKLVAEHLQKERKAGGRLPPLPRTSLLTRLDPGFFHHPSHCCLFPLSVTDVSFVPVSRLTGRVEVEEVVAAVRDNTCLVSIMLANNETGVIMVRDWKNP